MHCNNRVLFRADARKFINYFMVFFAIRSRRHHYCYFHAMRMDGPTGSRSPRRGIRGPSRRRPGGWETPLEVTPPGRQTTSPAWRRTVRSPWSGSIARRHLRHPDRPWSAWESCRRTGHRPHPSTQPKFSTLQEKGRASARPVEADWAARKRVARSRNPRQPPCCMCSRILAPMVSIRANCFASASRTTAFWSAESVA
jgi:hypothetical protein